MSYHDICYLSATEVLDRFRRRQLSPVELMQAIIKRAERMEPRQSRDRSNYDETNLSRFSLEPITFNR